MAATLPCRKVVVLAFIVVLALVPSVTQPGFGQSLYGSLVGTVTDPSGLAVPGATVAVTQTETSQAREATTTETGGYTFSNLPPGTYQVDVTLTGFQTFRAPGVRVSHVSAVRVDAKLNVGALQEAEVAA